MKIRVKVLILSLVMGILLSMTTACWEDLTAKTKGESGLVGGINGSPLNNAPSTRLKFSVNDLPADFNRVADEIEMRSRSTLNIELDFKNVEYDEFRIEKIAKLFISSDAVLLPSESALKYCAGKDFLADITELLPQYAPHIYSLLSEDALKQVTFDNKVVAIPSLISFTNRLYVIAQKSLVDKYYIENISSFEEFESFLSTIRKLEPDYIPCLSNFLSLEMFMECNGYVNFGNWFVYKWDDPEMKLMRWEKTDAFKNAVAMLKRWQDNGLIDYYPKNRISMFNENKLASIVVNGDKQLLNILGELYGDYEVFTLYPSLKVSRVALADNVIVFSANSKNIEAALRFLDWVVSYRESYDLLMYGIEGIHYRLEGEKIRPDEKNKYNGSSVFSVLQKIDQIRTPQSMSIDLKDLLKTTDDKPSDYPPHSGFSLTFKHSDEEIANKMNEIWQKRVQFIVDMLYQVWESRINIDLVYLIDEQEEANLYMDAVQTYLDEWNAEKKSAK